MMAIDTSSSARRRPRIAGALLLVTGSVGVVLFAPDALREDPAIFGVLWAVGAAIQFYGGIRTYRGRSAGGSIAAVGISLLG